MKVCLSSSLLLLPDKILTSRFYRGQILAERLALYFQAYTLYSSVRPFGLSALVAGWDAPASVEGTDELVERRSEGKPALYMVEPSGTFWASSSHSPSLWKIEEADLHDARFNRATEVLRLERESNWQRLRLRNSIWIV